MRKMRLDLDKLTIESFPTVADGAGQYGTVQGNQISIGGSCLITCASECSETDGFRACKTCGACC